MSIAGEGHEESHLFYFKNFKINDAIMMHKSDDSFENINGKAQVI